MDLTARFRSLYRSAGAVAFIPSSEDKRRAFLGFVLFSSLSVLLLIGFAGVTLVGDNGFGVMEKLAKVGARLS